MCVFLFAAATKEALKSGLSDMDYLRSKVAQIEDAVEKSDEKNEGDGDEDDDGPVQPDSAYESGERENNSKTKAAAGDKKQSKIKKDTKQEVCPWFSLSC